MKYPNKKSSDLKNYNKIRNVRDTNTYINILKQKWVSYDFPLNSLSWFVPMPSSNLHT